MAPVSRDRPVGTDPNRRLGERNVLPATRLVSANTRDPVSPAFRHPPRSGITRVVAQAGVIRIVSEIPFEETDLATTSHTALMGLRQLYF